MNIPNKRYPVILMDPPWKYYGDPNKDQAAGKHYKCMTFEELVKFPIGNLIYKNSIVFMWATAPMIGDAVSLFYEWELSCRGIAFVWIKTTNDGKIISGQGVRPSLIKPTDEFVLWGSYQNKGRPLPLKSEKIGMNILEPRPNNEHSRKPEEVHNRIEQLLDGPYLELFARRQRVGWDVWGDEI